MSGSIVPIIAATSAGAIAAAAAARQRQEEEEMTQYGNNDLDGWEFKIVRSNTGRFRKREVVEQLRQDEARAGWEMVEKFDNNRIRFKRRIEHRAQDSHLDIDPYRSYIGSGNAGVVLLVLGLVSLLALGIAALVYYQG